MEITLTQILAEINRLQKEKKEYEEAIKAIDSTLESIRNKINFKEDVMRQENETSFSGYTEIRNSRFKRQDTRSSWLLYIWTRKDPCDSASTLS